MYCMPSRIPRAPSWQITKTSELLGEGYFRAGFVFEFYAPSHVHYFLGIYCVVQRDEVAVLEYHRGEYLRMIWAGIGFSCYASSRLHWLLGRPFSSLHAWLRARAGAFATKNIELLSHLNPAVSFQSSCHIIENRRVSKRTIKMSNLYYSIQRDLFPNTFRQPLQSR